MRSLGLQDVFAVSEILHKLNIEIDTNALAEAYQGDDLLGYLGGQFFLDVIKKMHIVDNEVYVWFGSILNKTPEEVKQLSFRELKDVFKLIIESEDLSDFFASFGKEEPKSNTSSSENLKA